MDITKPAVEITINLKASGICLKDQLYELLNQVSTSKHEGRKFLVVSEHPTHNIFQLGYELFTKNALDKLPDQNFPIVLIRTIAS